MPRFVCLFCQKPFNSKHANAKFNNRSCAAKYNAKAGKIHKFLGENKWKDEDLISHILLLYKEYGRTPKIKELVSPSSRAYIRAFGSWNNALAASGLKPNLIKGELQRRRAIAREYCDSLRKNSICKDCGISDYRVLDFDHLPQYKKVKSVSYMIDKGWELEIIKQEVAKCDIVCANCHRIRTLTRRK